MSIIVSPNLVLTGGEFGLTQDHPIIGWHNIVTTLNIGADTANVNYPVSNLANPATHLKWKANDATLQYLTVTTGSADNIDYVAIARHNLASAAIPIEIGYFDDNSPTAWVTLVAESFLSNDGPALFRFTAQPLPEILIRLGVGTTVAQIAVVYVGKLLVLPRKLYQDLTPLPFALNSKGTNGFSESGNFLGRIITQEFVAPKIPLSLIDPAYYRDHIDEFIAASKETPFFVGWRPQSYPDEIGYCLMTNNPMPVNKSPHGLIAMSLEMTGIV